MSDFKAEMHQIRFRLGFRPRLCWGSLQCSPDSLAGLRGPTSKGVDLGEGRKGEEGEGKREEMGMEAGKGEGRGGAGMGVLDLPLKYMVTK